MANYVYPTSTHRHSVVSPPSRPAPSRPAPPSGSGDEGWWEGTRLGPTGSTANTQPTQLRANGGLSEADALAAATAQSLALAASRADVNARGAERATEGSALLANE
jgi:hypothetical protein